MHHFCLKFKKKICRGGKAPSPDPTTYPSSPVPKFWIRRCILTKYFNNLRRNYFNILCSKLFTVGIL